VSLLNGKKSHFPHRIPTQPISLLDCFIFEDVLIPVTY